MELFGRWTTWQSAGGRPGDERRFLPLEWDARQNTPPSTRSGALETKGSKLHPPPEIGCAADYSLLDSVIVGACPLIRKLELE